MADERQIYFIVEEQVAEEVEVPVEGTRDGRTDTGGGWGAPRRSRVDAIARHIQQKRIGVSANALKAQVQELRAVVNDLFDQEPQAEANQPSHKLQLEEVTLSVQVNAKGELGILGTGGELGGSGGITLKFARPKP